MLPPRLTEEVMLTDHFIVASSAAYCMRGETWFSNEIQWIASHEWETVPQMY